MDPQTFNSLTTQEVCVISYNSRGFNKLHQEFIKTLVSDQVVGDNFPIICNQENFILKGNFYKILQAVDGFHFIINPAIKVNLDRGRPKGGMFIAVPDSIKSQVTDVSPGHWRVQAVVISSTESRTLLLNTYLPCDNGRMAGGAIEEVLEVIEVLRKVIEENNCDSVLWCGDINTDFRRNTEQVEIVNDLIEELQLQRISDQNLLPE